MPFTADLNPDSVGSLRTAIVKEINKALPKIKTEKAAKDENDILAEIQADLIRLRELNDGRVSQDTLDLYGIKN